MTGHYGLMVAAGQQLSGQTTSGNDRAGASVEALSTSTNSIPGAADYAKLVALGGVALDVEDETITVNRITFSTESNRRRRLMITMSEAGNAR